MSVSAETRLFGERYRATRLLKQGKWVQTLLAEDTVDSVDVVVKTTSAAVSPAAQARLEHEAKTLRTMRSPALAPLLDLGREEGLLYLVMPYIEGVDLQTRLQDGPLGLNDGMTVARWVLEALGEAHSHGILHRDIKPANVIVAGDSGIERATLIDFGLARSGELDRSIRDYPVGTARYVSPEQAGLLGDEVDERSDLYSLGIVLFECLAGRPLFEGDTVGELLRQHLTTPAPELRDLGRPVPRVVDEVVQRLLRKDPSDRYQTAAAALADVADISEALARGVEEPAITIGLRDRRHSVTEPAFVGRAPELARLDEYVNASRRGEGGLVLLAGESGSGKTRLLQELTRRAPRRGATVMRGQALDQGAQRPFEMLAGIAGTLAELAQDDPALRDALRERLADSRAAICAAIPQLGETLGATGPDRLGPEDFGEARSLDGLCALLDALGSAERPVVLLLDDCQWADELTVKLLRRWHDERAPGMERHAVVVAAFRAEEVDEDAPLRAGDAPEVALASFDEDDVKRLVESMVGEVPDAAIEAIVRLSEGNPFMVSAVLRGLVESGALVGQPSGWEVDEDALAEARSSRQAAVFLSRRLELLPQPVLHLLEVAAVLGKEFDLELAAPLAGLPLGEAIAALSKARSRHIVWAQQEGRHAFVHDKLRETLLARLAAGERRALHLAAAQEIERLDPERVFELAYHFDAGDQSERALPYALQAAAEARGRHALAVAEEQYRIAGRGAGPHGDQSSKRQIAEGLGAVLMLRGDYEGAEEQLVAARAHADTDVGAAQLEGMLGDLAFKRGNVRDAAQPLERALRLLGYRVPRSAFGYFSWCVWEIVVQAVHTLLPRVSVGRRRLDGAGTELLAIHLYSRLSHVYWFLRGKFPTLWSHLREMNLAERYPPTSELAQAYSEHAPVMTMVPWFSRGADYAQRSLAIRRELGDIWGEGQSLHFYGIVLYASSQYRACIECCRDAVRLLRRTGDQWEINTANWHIAFAHYRLGELEAGADMARAVHRAGIEIGDAQAAGIGLGAWAKATAGDVPAEVIKVELDRATDDVHTRAEVLQAEALRQLAAGDAPAAAETLGKAQKMVRDKGFKQEYVAPVTPWLATALRRCAEEAPANAPRRRRELTRRARAMSRRSLRVARGYPNNRPHALREAGFVAALNGRTRRAQRRLQRSLAIAEAQGAAYEAALTLLALGRVGRALGWPEASDHEMEGARRLVDIGAAGGHRGEALLGPARIPVDPVTLSLADRFDTLLDAGHEIASALSVEMIFAAVRGAALDLLRGQTCTVVRAPEDDDISLVTDDSGELDAVCRMLSGRALEAGRPVTFAMDESPQDTSDEAALTSVRSALCAPIFVRGTPVGCFYVAHHEIRGLFGDEEERLAAFIASLAGAALENAEGFAEVQALTKSLEARVEERTAQLGESNRQLDLGLAKLQAAYEREHAAAEQLKHQAFHDALTNLANRALFLDRVDHALPGARRRNERVAVLFLDLDDFKAVNDRLGHSFGDDLLIAVAGRLRDCLRSADTAARLAGDEFAILLDDVTHDEDAALAAGRVMDAFQRPFALDGHEVFINGSIGVALSGTAGIDDSAEHLLRNADVAMYRAKAQGKGRFEVYETGMHADVVARLELKSDLQRAIEQRDFVVHYQPIVALDGGAIVGAEALVRWRREDGSLVAPAEFIDLVEETGQIRAIGEIVLAESCRTAGALEAVRNGTRPLKIHVNLSPRQLQEPDLVNMVAEALGEHGLGADSLLIEITETALMRDPEATIARLHRLKALGVGLAIDDFGTGYSSLRYLRDFPVDMIKIDKTFVDGVAHSPEAAAFADVIVKLGGTLKVQTVAEGIEHANQAQRLREIGCELGQGFFFARPVAAEQLSEIVAAGGQLVGPPPAAADPA